MREILRLMREKLTTFKIQKRYFFIFLCVESIPLSKKSIFNLRVYCENCITFAPVLGKAPFFCSVTACFLTK